MDPPVGCGEPLGGGKRPSSGRQTPHHGWVSPGLPSLIFLEFYSFPFFEIFSVCLFFIVFQDKAKESTQQMGILQEVRILFFLSCPGGLGRPGPSPGTGAPPRSPSVFRVASVAPCLRLTVLHCLHAPEADVSGAWSSCAAACLPDGIVINHSIGHRCRPRRFLRRACLSPAPIPVPSCPSPVSVSGPALAL